MKNLIRLLRCQRGDLLIDSMFAAVVLAIVMTASGAVLMAAAGAASGNHDLTSRSGLLNTVLSDEKPRLDSYTSTPTTVTRTAAGKTVNVTIWRTEPTPGTVVLNAATPKRATSESTDCTVPDQVSAQGCLTARTVTPISSAGVSVTPLTLAPGTSGALHDFTVPAGATELRYVLKVTDASGDSIISFGNRDHTGATHKIAVPTGKTGYFYGRIQVDPGHLLFISSSGPAVLDSASTLIYEAP